MTLKQQKSALIMLGSGRLVQHKLQCAVGEREGAMIDRTMAGKALNKTLLSNRKLLLIKVVFPCIIQLSLSLYYFNGPRKFFTHCRHSLKQQACLLYAFA